MKVAIFDFDGTIYPKETFPLMRSYLKNHPIHHKQYREFFKKILPVYLAYKMKLYPEMKMRSKAMQRYISSLDSLSEAEMDQFFEQLGSKMAEELNELVVERLMEHKRDGYYTMVVSGAFEPLLYSVFHDNPFDCTIGTAIPKERSIPVDHINGKRKIVKIMEHFNGHRIDWEHSYGYSDSYTDLDMLELVGNPIAVQPDARLLQVAEERKWEIIL